MSELVAAKREVGDGEILGEDGGGNLERKLVDGWKTKKNQIIQKEQN